MPDCQPGTIGLHHELSTRNAHWWSGAHAVLVPRCSGTTWSVMNLSKSMIDLSFQSQLIWLSLWMMRARNSSRSTPCMPYLFKAVTCMVDITWRIFDFTKSGFVSMTIRYGWLCPCWHPDNLCFQHVVSAFMMKPFAHHDILRLCARARYVVQVQRCPSNVAIEGNYGTSDLGLHQSSTSAYVAIHMRPVFFSVSFLLVVSR
jgi:hypothetical protein